MGRQAVVCNSAQALKETGRITQGLGLGVRVRVRTSFQRRPGDRTRVDGVCDSRRYRQTNFAQVQGLGLGLGLGSGSGVGLGLGLRLGLAFALGLALAFRLALTLRLGLGLRRGGILHVPFPCGAPSLCLHLYVPFHCGAPSLCLHLLRLTAGSLEE